MLQSVPQTSLLDRLSFAASIGEIHLGWGPCSQLAPDS